MDIGKVNQNSLILETVITSFTHLVGTCYCNKNSLILEKVNQNSLILKKSCLLLEFGYQNFFFKN